MTTRAQIEKTLWDSCGTFRGKIDSSKYKDYILSMLFVKYLSDVNKQTKEELTQRYGSDKDRIERALQRERFYLPETATFDFLHANRKDTKIGEMINKSLAEIENSNSGKLRDVFRSIDFNSSVDFSNEKEKVAILKNLLEDFAKLDLMPKNLEKKDIVGQSYMYMIAKFASDAGKKGGEFFTPDEVSELLARLVKPQENDRIYDGTCGSGSLLIRAFEQVKSGKAQIYGQEQNGQTWALCNMNMLLHGIDDAKIFLGDTISNPQTIENNQLMKFQSIVANPPFSLDKWAYGYAIDMNDDKFKFTADMDIYHRFDWGVPPKSKGDYAFILHMLASLADKGKMGVIMPHGVLFRGASEGEIRKKLITLGIVDAVVGLPANLFYGTSIPACILLFRKSKPNTDVLFIDASGEGRFEKGKNQNKLREQDINAIVEKYEHFKNGNYEKATEEKFSHIATFEEMQENDFNLNIPRYVETFEEEEIIDIEKVNEEIADTKIKLAEIERKMQAYLKELGLE